MEHNGGNQNMPPTTLCRTGCGFYSSPAFEGLCSKCYKDALKRKNQNSSPTAQVTGRSTPTVEHVLEGPSSLHIPAEVSTATIAVDTSTTPDVSTGTPTISTASGSDKSKDEEEETSGAIGGSDVAKAGSDGGDTPEKEKKPKKNRCHSCKKKIGLTGFECRCGGLYCSLHRYSDEHDCQFNYKEMAQAQIRKANPVIVGQKIQKI